MRKLYGDSLRNDAGFVKVIKKVANKNARLLESRAGRHAPEIRRVAREVKGTFDKVYEETADVVEEFLAKCQYPLFTPGREIPAGSRARAPFDSTSQDLGGCAGHQDPAPAVAGAPRHIVRLFWSANFTFSLPRRCGPQPSGQ